jgi:hypothetical protein
MLAGKNGSAFLEIFELGHYLYGDLFRGRRNLVELALQALPNQPEPLGLD